MTKLDIAKNLTINSEDLFRGHIAIVGSTGAGKSRHVSAKLLSVCLEGSPTAPDGTPYAFIVIDTNDEYVGFLDHFPNKVVVFSHDSTKGVPFRITSKNITFDDLTTFLKEVTRKELTKAELSTIYLAMDELRTKGDYTIEQLFTRLYELEAYSILPAFEKIMASQIFAPEETPLALIARQKQASILAIGGLPSEIQSIIVSHLLRKLFLARKNAEIGPVCVFLEEASVFCPEGELAPSSDILKLIATQGRGYNFILASIFQRSSLTSKNVLSQTGNYFIGKTGNPIDRQAIMRSAENIETEHDKIIKNLKLASEFLVTGFIVDKPVVAKIPDQNILVSKGGRIKPKVVEESFKREDIAQYLTMIRSLEENEHKRLETALAKVREEREARTKAPAIPKETEHEIDRLKRELEQSQSRYQRAIESLKEKEKVADRKARERYETQIKELNDTVERLTMQVTIAGAEREKPVWEQDIVKQRLKPLSEKQQHLIIFLERIGPSSAEKIAPTLGVAPKTITSYVSAINKTISGLLAFDDRKGTYYSRLSELFPVGETAKRESEQIKQLSAKLADTTAHVTVLQEEITKLHTQLQATEQKGTSTTTQTEREKNLKKLLVQIDAKLIEIARSND